IAAVGPLNVETKPILMLSAASAGCASARTVAPASHNAFFIFTPLLVIEPERDDVSSNRHLALSFLFEHDLFGKPVPTFPDHALTLNSAAAARSKGATRRLQLPAAAR